jgi:hypothetical protein
MNTVEIDGIRRELPASWDELSRKQLILVSDMFQKGLFNVTDAVTIVDFKVKLIFSMLNLKLKKVKNISAEDLFFIGETINFLLEAVMLTKQKLPRIRRYYGPDEGMKNCTFGEFITAQVKLEAFDKSKDPALLSEMVAILYRPKKAFWFIRKHFTSDIDCRVKLVEKNIAKRGRRLSRHNKAELYAVYLFFSGVIGSLPKIFPNVYRKKGDNDGSSFGWAGLVISMADGKTDDESLRRIMDSNLYNVFMGLEQKAKEYYSFQEKQKKS